MTFNYTTPAATNEVKNLNVSEIISSTTPKIEDIEKDDEELGAIELPVGT